VSAGGQRGPPASSEAFALFSPIRFGALRARQTGLEKREVGCEGVFTRGAGLARLCFASARQGGLYPGLSHFVLSGLLILARCARAGAGHGRFVTGAARQARECFFVAFAAFCFCLVQAVSVVEVAGGAWVDGGGGKRGNTAHSMRFANWRARGAMAKLFGLRGSCRLEVCDTADLEVCATPKGGGCLSNGSVPGGTRPSTSDPRHPTVCRQAVFRARPAVKARRLRSRNLGLTHSRMACCQASMERVRPVERAPRMTRFEHLTLPSSVAMARASR